MVDTSHFILKPVTTAVGGGDGFAVVERAC
jgi:hypothetical protein